MPEPSAPLSSSARRAPAVMLGLALLALLALGLGACAGPAEQLGSSEQLVTTSRVFQRGTFGAVADTYLGVAAAKKNFGDQKKLVVSAMNESLLRFDLSSIPSNAVIDGATLTVLVNGGDEEADDACADGDHEGHAIAPIKLHRATAAWSEGDVTYRSFDQRFDPAVAGVMVLTSRRTLKSVDLRALVQGWVSGATPNFGVVFTTAGRAHTLFASSEHNQVGQRPSLSVTYTVPDEHCAPDPCEHGGTCANQVDGFTCACTAGYEGDRCQTEIDDCAGDPCVHGTCADVGLAYTCACAPGYAGANCEIDVDECDVDPCQHGGTCTQGVDSYTCACPAGYSGARCEIDIDECAGDPCQHGGACTDGIADYTCTCTAGFEGTDCELNHDDCAGNPCAHGTCEDGLDAYTCACEPGYEGPTCADDIVDCTAGACLNGGACHEDVGGYTCTCPAGFEGTHCELDIDDCADHPCEHGGLCVDGVDAFTCTCAGSYTGPTCAIAGAVETRLVLTAPPEIVAGVPFEVTALLTTADGAPVASTPVVFTSDRGEGMGTGTDATGHASVAFGPAQIGLYRLTVTYDGDADHLPSTATAEVDVTPAISSVVAGVSSPAIVGSPVEVTAWVLRMSAPPAPMEGEPVTITIDGPDGTFVDVTSTGAGMASVMFTPSLPGPYTVTVVFDGDPYLAPASASTSFVAECAAGWTGPTCAAPPATSFTLTPVPAAYANHVLTVTALLRDAGGAPMGGRPVLLGASCGPSVATNTDATGQVRLPFTPGAAGTCTVTASYAGDATHGASSGQITFPVLTSTTAIVITPVPTSPVGAPVQIDATLRDLEPPTSTIALASLTYRITTPSGSTTTRSASTGQTSPASVLFTPTSAGEYTVVVSYAGSPAYASASAVTTFVAQ